jgi:hypothetical protein
MYPRAISSLLKCHLTYQKLHFPVIEKNSDGIKRELHCRISSIQERRFFPDGNIRTPQKHSYGKDGCRAFQIPGSRIPRRLITCIYATTLITPFRIIIFRCRARGKNPAPPRAKSNTENGQRQDIIGLYVERLQLHNRYSPCF